VILASSFADLAKGFQKGWQAIVDWAENEPGPCWLCGAKDQKRYRAGVMNFLPSIGPKIVRGFVVCHWCDAMGNVAERIQAKHGTLHEGLCEIYYPIGRETCHQIGVIADHCKDADKKAQAARYN
jgi:hypothetical protein